MDSAQTPDVANRTGRTIGSYTRRRWAKIVFDSLLLVGFLAEFITREGPDYDLHSWVGIVLIPIIALHLSSNVAWVRRVWKRRREDREFRLGVLNAVLGALAAICIVTGFPLWLEWSQANPLSVAHAFTGFVSIALMFVHLWLNRKRVVGLIRA